MKRIRFRKTRHLVKAKHCGYSEEGKDCLALAEFTNENNCYMPDIFAQSAQECKRYVGYLTDDGCLSVMKSSRVMSSRGSDDKDRAWGYLSFLPGREAGYRSADGKRITLGGGIAADDKTGQNKIQGLNWNEEAYRKLYDIDEETVKDVEDVSHRPPHTEPIREIICEETDFLNESKSIEEVGKVIQNRAHLYREEH